MLSRFTLCHPTSYGAGDAIYWERAVLRALYFLEKVVLAQWHSASWCYAFMHSVDAYRERDSRSLFGRYLMPPVACTLRLHPPLMLRLQHTSKAQRREWWSGAADRIIWHGPCWRLHDGCAAMVCSFADLQHCFPIANGPAVGNKHRFSLDMAEYRIGRCQQGALRSRGMRESIHKEFNRIAVTGCVSRHMCAGR